MTEPLVLGNAAKLYCLQWIERLAAERPGLRVLDLGCGRGDTFEALLRSRPEMRYVGVEPDADAADAARHALPRAEIITGWAHELELEPADVVVSFSVLEHVFRRSAYVASIARHLAPGGLAFVNYDAGHFVAGSLRERLRTLAAPLAARLGRADRYQAFVREAEFRRLAAAAGLEIVEAKSFNTLKDVYYALPQERWPGFMEPWLALELAVNELGVDYRDELARVFRTRNFVLRKA